MMMQVRNVKRDESTWIQVEVERRFPLCWQYSRDHYTFDAVEKEDTYVEVVLKQRWEGVASAAISRPLACRYQAQVSHAIAVFVASYSSLDHFCDDCYFLDSDLLMSSA